MGRAVRELLSEPSIPPSPPMGECPCKLDAEADWSHSTEARRGHNWEPERVPFVFPSGAKRVTKHRAGQSPIGYSFLSPRSVTGPGQGSGSKLQFWPARSCHNVTRNAPRPRKDTRQFLQVHRRSRRALGQCHVLRPG